MTSKNDNPLFLEESSRLLEDCKKVLEDAGQRENQLYAKYAILVDKYEELINYNKQSAESHSEKESVEKRDTHYKILESSGCRLREELNSSAEQSSASNKTNQKITLHQEHFYKTLKIVHSIMGKSSPQLYEESLEISRIAASLANYCGLNPELTEKIRVAALIHNMGIIGLREKLYNKNGALNKVEQQLLESHVEKSVEWVQEFHISRDIQEIVLQHHENYDGSGYPAGLQGNAIAIGARIIRLIDDFVLISKKRVFQTTEKKAKLLKVIQKNRGILYDPIFSDKLVELVNRGNFIFSFDKNRIEYRIENDEKIWTIPSNVSFEIPLSARVIEEIKKSLSISREAGFLIEYGISEIVRNAIIHGNHYIEDKKVTVIVKIQKHDTEKNKIIIRILDEGSGMDYEAHHHFVQSRDELFHIIDLMRKIPVDFNKKEDETAFNMAVEKISKFRDRYFMDYNAYRRKELSDMSGGLGILQVKNSFDDVIIRHIINNNDVCGTEVTLVKLI